jgi:anti-sigma regulatory factor (Ser/Thr protein kinase)
MPTAALSIQVPAEAEQMASLRAEIEEYGHGIGAGAVAIEDAQTIVTEACGNSIRHAYGDSGDGFLQIRANVDEGDLCLVIRDFGSGVGPQAVTARPSLHAGLAIIGALSKSFRLSSHRGRGTELEARLSLCSAA